MQMQIGPSNLEFKRTGPEGHVLVKFDGKEVIILSAHWCSIVCAVSLGGEESGRWYRVGAFHMGDGSATPSDKL